MEQNMWKIRLLEEMKLKGFSSMTIKAYFYHINDFLEYCNFDYRLGRKREYLLHLINKEKSGSSIRLASAAIDFYLVVVLGLQAEGVSLPKKKKHIPNVLTKEQIKRMIESTENLKHKLIIEILYSSGLRLSELLNLRFDDIDFEKSVLRVRDGKGSKDRITILSRKTAERLRLICEKGFVFKGVHGKYSGKSVQLVIERTAKNSGITINVTPHMLRHSFATHLLESGIDIRYIQALLGHSNLSTTQIYTRVAKNKIEEIKNPLDD